MKRKRFRIYMITFIIISISVLSGFMINSFQNRKKTISGGSETSVSESVIESPSGTAKDEVGFDFYVNESAVKKTKTTSNEVTVFVIEAKLFITNKSSKSQTIDPDAFQIFYDTEGTGLLYSIDYGNLEKPVILEGKATQAINFTIKYLIHDKENFNDTKKSELKFNYMSEQILVCVV